MAKRTRRMSYLFELTSAITTEEDDVLREARWIRKNIYMRVCSRFFPIQHRSNSRSRKENTDEEVCACGYTFDQHSRRDGIGDLTETRPWSLELDTKRAMTNAFGEVEFVGFEEIQRKYVRVDVNTPQKDMIELLLKCWGLKKPNLLISVTGGAKNFHMKAKLREVFRRGLIKVTKSTGAWIITGGTNTGVMKHVGEAVRDYRLTATSSEPVVAIGVVTWGCIRNKEDLIDNFGTGSWPAVYKIEIPKQHECCLEPNHTHFIMVDDGTQSRFGVDISFRARLERAVSDMKTEATIEAVSIPIVLLIVEGGMGTLQSAYEAIINRIPIVVVKGSGRIADIIAYAYQYSQETEIVETTTDNRFRKRSKSHVDSILEEKLKSQLVELFGLKKLEENYQRVCGCLEKRDLVTVFDISNSVTSSSRDIDVAILKALLKANKDAVYDQLKLALSWNRIDIAKSEIFTEEKTWPSGSLDDIMFEAIQANRVDFVDLLIDNGVSLKEFLTKDRLLQFYNLAPKNSLFYTAVMESKSKHGNKSDSITLKDIRRLTKLLISVCIQPFLSRPANQITRTGSRRGDCRHPSEDLFLWAVLLHKQEMAKLFWKLGKDATPYALIAFGILRALAKNTDDTELRNKLLQNAEEFGDLAVGVLTECFQCDERKTHALLMRKLEQCDGIMCLDIALKTNNLLFISHKACQSFYREIWMGNLAQNNSIVRILLSPIILGPFILKVKEPVIKLEDQTMDEEMEAGEKVRSLDRRTGCKAKSDSLSKSGSTMNILDEDIDFTEGNVQRISGIMRLVFRVRSVYTAPVMVFAHNVIAYIVFLSLFSYMLLFEFSDAVGTVEKLLYVWVFNIFVEEIRQFGTSSQRRKRREKSLRLMFQRFQKKKREYLSDEWNIVDIVTIALFIFGVILRYCPNGLEIARIMLAFSLLTFYFRILHIFTVHKELGPKIIMIRRMTVDLVFFLIILMVFVSSYAITSYSILFPNSNLSYPTIRNILRIGYWTLYGEFFLNEIENPDVNCSLHGNGQYMKDGKMERCPLHGEVALFMMGVYVLFANLLLLNILIAMFSNTFQQVHDNTDRLWNYMRCTLIKEFHAKPFLPAPLSLPIYLWLFLKWLLNRVCGWCTKMDDDDINKRTSRLQEATKDKNGIVPKAKSDEFFDREITQWENVIADTYLQRLKKEEQESMENVVAELNRKFDDLCQREHDGSFHSEMNQHIEKKLYSVEKKMDRMMNLLRAMSAENRGGQSSSPHSSPLPSPVEKTPSKIAHTIQLQSQPTVVNKSGSDVTFTADQTFPAEV